MLRAARRFATDDSPSIRHSTLCSPGRRIVARTLATPLVIRHSPSLPRPAYALAVKIILLCLAAIVGSSFAGCASKKPKSRYRNYEGDSNPGIRMLEEKPGSPLNTR